MTTLSIFNSELNKTYGKETVQTAIESGRLKKAGGAPIISYLSYLKDSKADDKQTKLPLNIQQAVHAAMDVIIEQNRNMKAIQQKVAPTPTIAGSTLQTEAAVATSKVYAKEPLEKNKLCLTRTLAVVTAILTTLGAILYAQNR